MDKEVIFAWEVLVPMKYFLTTLLASSAFAIRILRPASSK
jgi:hypothetical protein